MKPLTQDEKLALAAALYAHPDSEVFSVFYEIMDLDTLMRLMITMGGKTIRIPSASMVAQSLEVARAAMYAFVNKRSVTSSCYKFGIPDRVQEVETALAAIKRNSENRARMKRKEQEVLDQLSL